MKKLLIPFITILVLATGYALVLFGHEMCLQVTVRPKIEKELGFTLGTPYVDDGSPRKSEVIAISTVSTNGILHKNGVQPGDIIVREKTIGNFCKRLDQPHGEEVTLYLVSDGDGLPVQQRPVKEIAFVMP